MMMKLGLLSCWGIDREVVEGMAQVGLYRPSSMGLPFQADVETVHLVVSVDNLYNRCCSR